MEISSVMLLVGIVEQVYSSVCLNCAPKLFIHPVCHKPNYKIN